MISVVIPLYNKVHFIKATIESVLAQTYTDMEIIIVNDGSTDGSVDVVKSFRDSRIRLIDQSNGGVSKARNHGLREAKGDFIALLDADDTWCPGFLQTMTTLAKQYPQESVFGAAQVNRPIKTLPEGVSLVKDFCSFFYCFCTGSLLIKREVFEEVGYFREGIQIGEDFDVWLRIACHYHYVYLNEPFLIHPETTENNLSMIRELSKTFPFWEWYAYPYTPKSSLYRYTTDRIVSSTSRLVKERRFSEALILLMKIKGHLALRPRIKLLIKILMRRS